MKTITCIVLVILITWATDGGSKKVILFQFNIMLITLASNNSIFQNNIATKSLDASANIAPQRTSLQFASNKNPTTFSAKKGLVTEIEHTIKGEKVINTRSPKPSRKRSK